MPGKNRNLRFMSVPAKMGRYRSARANRHWETLQLRSRTRDDAVADGDAAYQRRPRGCCIRPGDTDGGGLDMVRPLAGLMMGMALRVRVAAGWCSFSVAC